MRFKGTTSDIMCIFLASDLIIQALLKEPVQRVSQAPRCLKALAVTGFSLCLGHLRGQNVYFEKITTIYFKFKCYIIEFFNFDFLFVVFKFCTLFVYLAF